MKRRNTDKCVGCTDLCVLVFGFSDFVVKGKRIKKWAPLGDVSAEVGYLSVDQMHHAIRYIETLRLPAPKPAPKKTHIPAIKKVNLVQQIIDMFKKMF